MKQKKRQEALKYDHNNVPLVVEPLPIDDINYPDPSAVSQPSIPADITQPKPHVSVPRPEGIPASKPVIPSAPKPDIPPKTKNDIIVPADKLETPG